MLDKTFFMKDNVCAGKKNYKSRCISINIVTFNQVGRKILKISCATLSLFAVIHSSDVATNRITDFYHASAVKNSENKNSKIQNSKKEDNKDNIVVSKKAIPDKKENNEFDSKSVIKDIIKSKEKTKKDVKPDKKSKQQNKKIANIIRTHKQGRKSKSVQHDLKNYECTDVLHGDATFYTARPGKRMSSGKTPVAGRHCAMHPRFKGSLAKVTFPNNRTVLLEVEDTGKALIDGDAAIDIFCDNIEECIQNGRQKVKVEVFKKKA